MGGEEEEVIQAEDNIEYDNPEKFEEDFEFIDEELTRHMFRIKQNEAVLKKVQRSFEKGKRKIPEEMQRSTLEEVKNLEENFHKVIGYAQILMDNVRKF